MLQGRDLGVDLIEDGLIVQASSRKCLRVTCGRFNRTMLCGHDDRGVTFGQPPKICTELIRLRQLPSVRLRQVRGGLPCGSVIRQRYRRLQYLLEHGTAGRVAVAHG